MRSITALRGRGRQRHPRHGRRAVEGRHAGPTEEVLSRLRDDGPVAGPEPADPRQHGRGGLLAYVLVSKFDDHLPLCRLVEIFARMRAVIPKLAGGLVRPRHAGPSAARQADRDRDHGR